ncbi:hypothetical protein [Vibrio campbellii]|uniref:hypothetical protein n=1 Tax=Vibrio campbellii TaxID=680 RepID=UPI00249AB7A0|nr:hypothetical protein [Vibrio campbellii]
MKQFIPELAAECRKKDFKQAISDLCTLALVDNRLKMFFEMVNLHDVLPKKGSI